MQHHRPDEPRAHLWRRALVAPGVALLIVTAFLVTGCAQGAGTICATQGPMPQAEQEALIASCERAVPAVREAWPEWEPQVVITAATEPLPEGIAARVVGTGREGEPTSGDRLVVAPDLPQRLSPEGLDVVLRHELTHLATRSTTTAPVPLWAIEGLAELLAYAPVADDRRDRAADVARLRAAVDGGAWTGSVPTPEDLEGPGDLALAYTSAWLAMTVLADSEGLDRVVAAMQPSAAAGTGTGLDEAARERAFLERIGVSRDQLQARWEAALRAD